MQKHNSRKKLHQKEQAFDLHWTVNYHEKQYNALHDPHSNYFFVSKVAKERLKDLKSQLRKEKKAKSPHKKEMIKVINEKIKFQFPKIKLPLLHGASVEDREITKDKRKMSHQFNKKILTERDRENGKKSSLREFKDINQHETEFTGLDLKASNEIKTRRSNRRLRHQKTQKNVKEKVNHEQFLSFLSKKKQALKEGTEQLRE